ncbi:MAG: autoinducer binding domain-containing protein [Rhodobacteraceae bacterium]|nr:autoinducer binding domain-containing protein [Paracoccaceae bacterium]
MFQTYPKPWIDYYSQNGLVMLDPTVRWGFENVGQIRWSKLAANDSDGVLALSAEHGLKFGLTYSFGPADRRSIASFARSDREFTDEEVTSLYTQTDALTAAIDQAGRLDDQTQGYLRKMSVIFTHP